MTVIGPLQQRILDHLHTPEPQTFMTTELAAELLGSTDREAVRQVRRAVDGLATRGLVATWTGSADRRDCGSPRWWSAEERQMHSAEFRSYIRPGRYAWTVCSGDGCEYCALGAPIVERKVWDPIDEQYFTGKSHNGFIIRAFKSRVRWVEYAWSARPPQERLSLLERWIDEEEAWLTEHPLPDFESDSFADAMRRVSHPQHSEELSRLRALRAETEADLPPPPPVRRPAKRVLASGEGGESTATSSATELAPPTGERPSEGGAS